MRSVPWDHYRMLKQMIKRCSMSKKRTCGRCGEGMQMYEDNYHYGLIGNCTTAALVSRDASIDWLCMPYFDSPSLFAKILDDQHGGHFKITGVDTKYIAQRYIYDTAILKTTIETEHGEFEIHDYMPRFLVDGKTYYCPSEIHRSIRVIAGQPKIYIDLKPMPNYALGGATYENHSEYIKMVSARGEYMSYYLYSNLDYSKIIQGHAIELTKYSYIVISYHEKLNAFTTESIYHQFEKTKAYWIDYVDQTHYPEKYREAVIRSAITLKLLSYQKTGAVLAAPTTSLPETIGEERNWDYRYCWMRDGGMTIDVYSRIGDFETSSRFMQYIIQRLPLKNDAMHIMYSIEGEKYLDEKIQTQLAGYQNSFPVRIGNAAYKQKQNDLYGHLIEAIYTFFLFNNNIRHRNNVQINEEIWTLVRSLVNRISHVWGEPDNGIWEFRGQERHFSNSKLMSWVGMDRAAKIAAFWGKTKYIKGWRKLATTIKNDLLTHAWSDRTKTFTMYYHSDVYDASNLLMLHYNILDRKDERIINTVLGYYKQMVQNGFMFRYIDADDFGVPQNAFIACTFWMVNALYLIGEKAKARDMFENAIKYCNHLGLLSEAIDVLSGRLVGNFPQAYSHLSLIQSAFLLETEYNWLDKDASIKKTALY